MTNTTRHEHKRDSTLNPQESPTRLTDLIPLPNVEASVQAEPSKSLAPRRAFDKGYVSSRPAARLHPPGPSLHATLHPTHPTSYMIAPVAPCFQAIAPPGRPNPWPALLRSEPFRRQATSRTDPSGASTRPIAPPVDHLAGFHKFPHVNAGR